MTISKDEILHIAKLARLTLSEDEIGLYSKQLSEILSYIDQLNELDLENVEPLSHILDMVNVMREDKDLPSLAKKDIMDNAPGISEGYYKVPKVIQSGD